MKEHILSTSVMEDRTEEMLLMYPLEFDVTWMIAFVGLVAILPLSKERKKAGGKETRLVKR